MLRVRRRWAARRCLRLMLPPKPQRSSLPLAKVGSVGQGGSARGLSHILSATIYDCGPAGLVRRPLCQGFRLLGSSFGLGLPVLSAPKATSANSRFDEFSPQFDATIQAGIATVFALVVTFCRAFYNTFTLTFCITVVCSKGVRRNISSWTASPGLTRGTSDLRENRAIPTAARSPPSSPHSYV